MESQKHQRKTSNKETQKHRNTERQKPRDTETQKEIEWTQLRQALQNQEGLLWHDQAKLTPREHGAGSKNVHIARVRADVSDPARLSLWVVADNMRKGGAYNALQIYTRWAMYEQELHTVVSVPIEL